jgi:hypothetical protein
VRQEGGVDAVQIEVVRRQRADTVAHGLGHQPLAGIVLAHPVAEIDELGGAPADVGKVTPANQRFAPLPSARKIKKVKSVPALGLLAGALQARHRRDARDRPRSSAVRRV